MANKNAPLPGVDPLSEAIRKKIFSKFYEIVKHNNPMFYKNNAFVPFENTVLAGIAMTKKLDSNQVEIVSIATGTKILKEGRHPYVLGLINDSHAEIIARRSFLLFLHTQLRLLISSDFTKDTVFTNSYSGKYLLKVKPNIHFHLFISKLPCGYIESHKSNGKLRRKTHGGTTGEICLKVQNSMCCSDKITRWNVTGIQGALLSSLIEPIYLQTIIIGTKNLYSPSKIEDYLNCRLEISPSSLRSNFYFKTPSVKFSFVSSDIELTRLDRQHKGSPISINWNISVNKIEVVTCATGLTIDGQPSRLSKQAFLLLYTALMEDHQNKGYFHNNSLMFNNCNYNKMKRLVEDYQHTKVIAEKAFLDGNLGCWRKLQHIHDMNERNSSRNGLNYYFNDVHFPKPQIAVTQHSEKHVEKEKKDSFCVIL